MVFVLSSLAGRACLRVACWIAPPDGRGEWRARWKPRLSGWHVLLERGELARGETRRTLRLYRECFADALALRARSEAAQAVLQGPGLIWGAAAAILILLAAASHGFRGTRALFEPPPMADPQTLVAIQYPARPNDLDAALARLIPLWREQSALLRDVAGYGYAYYAPRAWVTPSFFAVLGTRAAAGRLFREGDREVAVLSDWAWRWTYRGNPRIVGSTIRVEGRTYTVIGTLPASFWALSPGIAVWTLWTPETRPSDGMYYLSGAVAQLRPAVDARRVGKELGEIAKAANQTVPRPVHILKFNALPGSSLYPYLLWTGFSLISALVLVAREHRHPARPSWGYGRFLAIKALSAVALPLLAWMEAGAAIHAGLPPLALGTSLVRIVLALLFLVACVWGLRWSFADQRRRCPVCLRRLAMPVRVGSTASVFDPALTELVCPKGHGALALPESETDRPDRWTVLDSSWDELFRDKSTADPGSRAEP